ncbi:MAG: glycosyltransferase family 39 protein, partial [Syntrophus sp. (in: bacteria)]
MMNSLHVPETQTIQTSVKLKWTYLLLVFILLGSIALRWHLLPIPLERDEGEYAYAGQLILQGIPPYVQLYNMKMPGIYLAFAIILAVFGETPTAIHTGLLFVNLTTILLLFLFTRKLFDDLTALTAAAAFTILSVNPFVHGVFAHAEHFVLLFVLASLLLLLNGLNRSQLRWMFLSGIFSGIAFLMKQPAASFTGLAITFILINDLFRDRPPSARVFIKPMTFMAGVLVPL